MGAREKAKAKQKYEAEKAKEFFEKTGIRDESEDFKLENMINKYEFDMAQMKLQDRKKRKEQRIKAFKDLNNIDPETGKPYKEGQ